MVTYLDPDILDCEVKWAIGSIIKNKASGGDRIPGELFQTLKDKAVKVLHSIQSLRSARFFAIPCSPMTAACQASLSITNSQSLLKLMFIEWVMPSNDLILCHPLLLLPLIFCSIRVFSYDFSVSQQIWKTQQWPQGWKRSVFIAISKKGNAKECSNYCTTALISHASKVMLKNPAS